MKTGMRGSILMSAPDVAQWWADKDGCPGPAAVNLLPDLSDDGTRVRGHWWSGCTGGAEVVLFEVEGGGHTWPGGSRYLPEAMIGRTSRDFDASEEIWKFFERRPRGEVKLP